MIYHGDCLDVMAGMDPESVDAIVTDPPYGLEFMGKEWDRGVPGLHFWQEMWRVAKPSSYLLSFGGTRTVHRIASNIEDAGWIIRDMLVWGYASGFPKGRANLKPAWEPIVMARKPGPLRMLAIDECRIPTDAPLARPAIMRDDNEVYGHGLGAGIQDEPLGRWPANIVLTDAIFDGGIEGVVGGGEVSGQVGMSALTPVGFTVGDHEPGQRFDYGQKDTGTYSRFFLIPKAARSDREPVLGGLPLRERRAGWSSNMPPTNPQHGTHRDGAARANHHPTVKPVDLMRHLVRLVTPTGGTVLDPFLGSGTTGLAAEMEGFAWVGIEREAEYVAIAEARLNGTQKGMAL